MPSAQEKYLSSWLERQEYAENMQPLINKLFRKNNIEITIYGRSLVNASIINIIKAHKMVLKYETNKLRLRDTYPLLQALYALNLHHAKIDLGKLSYLYQQLHAENTELTISDYLSQQLTHISDQPQSPKKQDVVLYGFGRIGRLLARLLLEAGPTSELQLKAIVVRGGDLEKRASLLRRDSIHGLFNGSVTTDPEKSVLKVNGCYIHVIEANSPNEVDYTKYGIDNALVIDNTGKWRDEAGLNLHLQAKGTSKVLLTAPGKGEIKNIVYGVNQQDITAEDNIISAASCTTNAIAPVLKVINEQFLINHGHVETVHSYTNDQNLIDNYHPAERRGRAAALNMVITSTGAAKAVTKTLPELAGKLTGNAIRVPTPNVSLAILNLSLNKATSVEQMNEVLKKAALFSDLQDQIDYTESTEVVSSDLIGSRSACIVDSQATIVEDEHAVLYVWYDNEFGYSCQVLRVMQAMVGTYIPSYPVQDS